MPNGIDLILADHRAVDELFAAFDKAPDGTIVGQVVDMLAAHDDAEQAALYPFAATVLSGKKTVLDRSVAAHSAVKQQIDHIKFQEGPALIDAFRVLRDLVKAHAQDEEKNLLPALAEAATPAQLDTLGARILQAKQRVG